MIYNTMGTLKRHVKVIEARKPFDPNLHKAVMHIEMKVMVKISCKRKCKKAINIKIKSKLVVKLQTKLNLGE